MSLGLKRLAALIALQSENRATKRKSRDRRALFGRKYFNLEVLGLKNPPLMAYVTTGLSSCRGNRETPRVRDNCPFSSVYFERGEHA